MAETFYSPQNCAYVDTFSIMPLLISHGSSTMTAGTDEIELSSGQQKEKEHLGLQRTFTALPMVSGKPDLLQVVIHRSSVCSSFLQPLSRYKLNGVIS